MRFQIKLEFHINVKTIEVKLHEEKHFHFFKGAQTILSSQGYVKTGWGHTGCDLPSGAA